MAKSTTKLESSKQCTVLNKAHNNYNFTFHHTPKPMENKKDHISETDKKPK